MAPCLPLCRFGRLNRNRFPIRFFDSDGLFLLVQPSGSLLWRFRYRKFGIERKLSLGSFPDVTLQQARKEHDKALAQLVGEQTNADFG